MKTSINLYYTFIQKKLDYSDFFLYKSLRCQKSYSDFFIPALIPSSFYLSLISFSYIVFEHLI